MMEENFGKVLFAKFVIDRATERPKGTAFVKFASEESANKCIAESVLTGANSAKGRVNFSITCVIFKNQIKNFENCTLYLIMQK